VYVYACISIFSSNTVLYRAQTLTANYIKYACFRAVEISRPAFNTLTDPEWLTCVGGLVAHI
jgi:hypothetical protein